MKKYIYLTITILSSTLFVVAQPSIVFGPGMAMNPVSVKKGTAPKDSPLIRYQVGMLYATPGNRGFVESGLFFTRKGAKYETEQKSTKGELISKRVRRVRYEYLEIPVNVGYNLMDGYVRVYAGPVISFGVGGGFENEFTTFNNEGSETDKSTGFVRYKKIPEKRVDNSIYANPIDLGFNFGVNVVSKANFSFGLNANIGLSNNQPKYKKAPADYDRSDQVSRHRFFGVRVSYLLEQK